MYLLVIFIVVGDRLEYVLISGPLSINIFTT